MANEAVPSVEIDVEKEIVFRAGDAARNDQEEISSVNLGGAGNRPAIVDIGLARIQKLKTSFAAWTLYCGDQRFLINYAIEWRHPVTQMGGDWHHSDISS